VDTLTFFVAYAAIATLAFLLAGRFDRRILAAFALLGALAIAADDLVTGLPTVIKSLDVLGGHWNWTGKCLSLVLSMAVIVAFRLKPATVGLTFEQRHTRIGLIALAFFIVWGTCLGLLFKPGVADAETLAFQGTMPGLAEELVYRGIAPALLLGLIRRRDPIEGTPWAVVLSTAVVFGVVHGLSYSHGRFGFDILSALFPFLGSIPGGWLRFKTRSLVVPILAHGVANVAFHVAGSLGT
jgi:membrane protease YdiL (CAAX protease family)